MLLPVALLFVSCGSQVDPGKTLPPPWNPPQTTIAPEFVAATKFLLMHGLGDPRGGTMKRVTIQKRDTWRAEPFKVETSGWVRKNGDVVCWDGLVYKPESVGAPLTVEEALENQLKPPAQSQAAPIRSPMMGPNGLVPAALLLIAGETHLAERTLKAPDRSTPGAPFVPLAGSFLVPRWHRAVHAHMAGDDKQAYADSFALARDWADYEAEAERLMGRESIDRFYEVSPRPPGPIYVFKYLYPADALRFDSERRLNEGTPKVDLKTLEGLAPEARIKTLIGWLDQIGARQWGQPGGVSIVSDPIAQALAKEGEAAVEPLIAAYENDGRLTRSVSFGRDFFPDRNLITVSSAAYAIVANILQLSLTGPDMYRPYSPEQLREFWKKNRGKSRSERLFDILADDAGNRRQWLEAAQQLVQSRDIRNEGGWVTVPDATKPQAPIVGEELRSRTNPSVADLLSRRALEVAGSGELQSSGDQFACAEALQIGLALAKWDRSAALQTLQRLTNRGFELSLETKHRGNAMESILPPLAQVQLERIRAGDETAWADYRRLAMNYETDSFFEPSIFRPLWIHKDHPLAKQLSRDLFLSDDSPVVGSMRAKDRLVSQIDRFIESPMIDIEPVRELVKRLLRDTSKVGSVTQTDQGIRYQFLNGGSGGMGLDPKLSPQPPVGTTGEYRMCDAVAVYVSRLVGAPGYNPLWTPAQKQSALSEEVAFLDSIPNRGDVLPDHVRGRFDRWGT